MIRIQNTPLPIGGGKEQFRKRAARFLGLSPNQLRSLTLARQSVDARKKSDVHYACTVHVEVDNGARIMARCRGKNVSLHAERPYTFLPVRRTSPLSPAVVGTGPPGLFAALFLVRNGVIPIVLERGCPVEERMAGVEHFWATGVLDTTSNVQFDEGGVGIFSDGKLTAGTHDPRISTVFRALVEAGTLADILYQHKPYIGTDTLRDVVRSMRRELLALGCDARLGRRLAGLDVRDDTLQVVAVDGPGGRYDLPCDVLALSPGHSARDTFQILLDTGVPMAPRSFAIGVCIEYAQVVLSEAQFGPAWERLPTADYKLACHLSTGRSAFISCVCPGGQAMTTASGEGRLVTSGTSCRARDGASINGGFLVGVSPVDFGSEHSLAGVEFQRRWEVVAYTLGDGGFRALAQMVADFLARRPSTALGRTTPTYRPGATPAELDRCLPDYMADTLRDAFPLFDRKLRGFAAPEAVFTGVESRSSFPVRIFRGEDFQSPIRGLYLYGEGAEYVDGITSIAMDGIRVAEVIAPK